MFVTFKIALHAIPLRIISLHLVTLPGSSAVQKHVFYLQVGILKTTEVCVQIPHLETRASRPQEWPNGLMVEGSHPGQLGSAGGAAPPPPHNAVGGG